ncbi:hypothetical protein HK102_005639, partial [Quaeritorhiza haematococci]
MNSSDSLPASFAPGEGTQSQQQQTAPASQINEQLATPSPPTPDLLTLEQFLRSSVPHPIKEHLAFYEESHAKLQLERDEILSKLQLETFEHMQTKRALEEVQVQLEIAQKNYRDLRWVASENWQYDPFSTLSVNASLQKKLGETKLELDRAHLETAHLKSELLVAVKRTAQLDHELQYRASRLQELEQERRKMADSLMKGQELVANLTGEITRLAAENGTYKKNNDAWKRQVEALEEEVKKFIEQRPTTQPATTNAKIESNNENLSTTSADGVSCRFCGRLLTQQHEENMRNAKVLGELQAEVVRLQNSSQYFKSTHVNTMKQLNAERDLLLAANTKIAELENQLKMAEYENERQKQQITSYMFLNEDQQRRLLTHNEYLQDYVIKTSEDSERAITILRDRCENLVGIVRQTVPVLALLQLKYHVERAEKERLLRGRFAGGKAPTDVVLESGKVKEKKQEAHDSSANDGNIIIQSRLLAAEHVIESILIDDESSRDRDYRILAELDTLQAKVTKLGPLADLEDSDGGDDTSLVLGAHADAELNVNAAEIVNESNHTGVTNAVTATSVPVTRSSSSSTLSATVKDIHMRKNRAAAAEDVPTLPGLIADRGVSTSSSPSASARGSVTSSPAASPSPRPSSIFTMMRQRFGLRSNSNNETVNGDPSATTPTAQSRNRSATSLTTTSTTSTSLPRQRQQRRQQGQQQEAGQVGGGVSRYRYSLSSLPLPFSSSMSSLPHVMIGAPNREVGQLAGPDSEGEPKASLVGEPEVEQYLRSARVATVANLIRDKDELIRTMKVEIARLKGVPVSSPSLSSLSALRLSTTPNLGELSASRRTSVIQEPGSVSPTDEKGMSEMSQYKDQMVPDPPHENAPHPQSGLPVSQHESEPGVLQEQLTSKTRLLEILEREKLDLCDKVRRLDAKVRGLQEENMELRLTAAQARWETTQTASRSTKTATVAGQQQQMEPALVPPISPLRWQGLTSPSDVVPVMDSPDIRSDVVDQTSSALGLVAPQSPSINKSPSSIPPTSTIVSTSNPSSPASPQDLRDAQIASLTTRLATLQQQLVSLEQQHRRDRSEQTALNESETGGLRALVVQKEQELEQGRAELRVLRMRIKDLEETLVRVEAQGDKPHQSRSLSEDPPAAESAGVASSSLTSDGVVDAEQHTHQTTELEKMLDEARKDAQLARATVEEVQAEKERLKTVLETLQNSIRESSSSPDSQDDDATQTSFRLREAELIQQVETLTYAIGSKERYLKSLLEEHESICRRLEKEKQEALDREKQAEEERDAALRRLEKLEKATLHHQRTARSVDSVADGNDEDTNVQLLQSRLRAAQISLEEAEAAHAVSQRLIKSESQDLRSENLRLIKEVDRLRFGDDGELCRRGETASENDDVVLHLQKRANELESEIQRRELEWSKLELVLKKRLQIAEEELRQEREAHEAENQQRALEMSKKEAVIESVKVELVNATKQVEDAIRTQGFWKAKTEELERALALALTPQEDDDARSGSIKEQVSFLENQLRETQYRLDNELAVRDESLEEAHQQIDQLKTQIRALELSKDLEIGQARAWAEEQATQRVESRLAAVVAEAESSQQAAERSLRLLQTDLEGEKRMNAEYQRQLLSVKHEISLSQSACRATEQNYSDEVHSLRQQVAKMQSDYESAVSQLQSRVSMLQDESRTALAKETRTHEETKLKLSVLERTFGMLQNQVAIMSAEHERDLAQLQAEKDQAQAAWKSQGVSGCEGTQEASERHLLLRVQVLEETLSGKNRLIRELKSNHENLRLEMETQSRKHLEAFTHTQSELLQRLDDAQTMVARLQQELTERLSAHAEAVTRLELVEQKSQADKDRHAAHVEAMAAKIADTTVRLDGYKAQILSRDQSLNDLKRERNSLSRTVETMKMQLEARVREVRCLQASLLRQEQLQEKLFQDLQVRVATLQQEVVLRDPVQSSQSESPSDTSVMVSGGDEVDRQNELRVHRSAPELQDALLSEYSLRDKEHKEILRELGKLRDEKCALIARIRSLTEQLQSRTRNVLAAEAHHRQNLDVVRSEVEAHWMQVVADLQAKLADTQQSVENTRMELEACKSNHQTAAANMVNKAASQATAFKTRETRLMNSIDALNVEVAKLQSAVESKTSRIYDLEQKLLATKKGIDVAHAESELHKARAESNLTLARHRVEALEVELSQHVRELHLSRQAFEEVKGNLTKKDAECVDLERQLEELTGRNKERNEASLSISDVDSAAVADEEATNQIRSSRDSSEEQKSILEARVARLLSEVVTLQTSLAQRDEIHMKKVAETEFAHTQTKAALKEVQQRLELALTDIDQERKQIVGLEEQSREMAREMDRLRESRIEDRKQWSIREQHLQQLVSDLKSKDTFSMEKIRLLEKQLGAAKDGLARVRDPALHSSEGNIVVEVTSVRQQLSYGVQTDDADFPNPQITLRKLEEKTRALELLQSRYDCKKEHSVQQRDVISRLRETIAEYEFKLVKLNQQNNDLVSELAAQEMQGKAWQYDDMEKQIREEKRRTEETRLQLEDLRRRYTDVEREKSAAQASIRDMVEKIGSLERSLVLLRHELECAQEKIRADSDVMDKLKSAQDTIDRMHQEILDADDANQNLVKERDAFKEQLALLHERFDMDTAQAHREIDVLRKELSDARNNLEEQMTKFNEVDSMRAQLEFALKEMRTVDDAAWAAEKVDFLTELASLRQKVMLQDTALQTQSTIHAEKMRSLQEKIEMLEAGNTQQLLDCRQQLQQLTADHFLLLSYQSETEGIRTAQSIVDRHLIISFQNELKEMRRLLAESDELMVRSSDFECRLAQMTAEYHLLMSYQDRSADVSVVDRNNGDSDQHVEQLLGLQQRLSQMTVDYHLLLSYESEWFSIKGEKETLASICDRLHVENARLSEDLNKGRLALQAAESVRDSLQLDVRTLTRELQWKSEDFDRKLLEKEEQLRTHQQTVESLQRNSERLSSALSEMERYQISMKQEMESHMANLRMEVQSKRQHVTALELNHRSTVSQFESERQSLLIALQQLQSEYTATQKQLQQKIGVSEHTIAELQKTLDSLRSENASLASEQQRVRADEVKMKAQVEEFEHILVAKDARIQHLSSLLKEKAAQLETAEKEYESHMKDLQSKLQTQFQQSIDSANAKDASESEQRALLALLEQTRAELQNSQQQMQEFGDLHTRNIERLTHELHLEKDTCSKLMSDLNAARLEQERRENDITLRVKTLESEISAKNERIQELEVFLDEKKVQLRDQAELLKQERETNQSEQSDLRAEIGSLQSNLDARIVELLAKDQHIASMKDSYTDRIDGLEQHLKQLADALENARTQTVDLQRSRVELESIHERRVAELEQKLRTLTDRNSTLIQRNECLEEQMRQRVSDLEDDISAKSTQIQVLENTVHEKSGQLASQTKALVEANDSHQNVVSALQASLEEQRKHFAIQIEELERTIDEYERDATELEEMHAKVIKELEEKQIRSFSVMHRKTEASGWKSRIAELVVALQQQAVELADNLKSLHAETSNGELIAADESKIDELQKTLSQTKFELHEKSATVIEMQKAHHVVIKNLRIENELLQKTFESRIEEVKSEAKGLEEIIEVSRQQLQETKASLTQVIAELQEKEMIESTLNRHIAQQKDDLQQHRQQIIQLTNLVSSRDESIDQMRMKCAELEINSTQLEKLAEERLLEIE